MFRLLLLQQAPRGAAVAANAAAAAADAREIAAMSFVASAGTSRLVTAKAARRAKPENPASASGVSAAAKRACSSSSSSCMHCLSLSQSPCCSLGLAKQKYTLFASPWKETCFLFSSAAKGQDAAPLKGRRHLRCLDSSILTPSSGTSRTTGHDIIVSCGSNCGGHLARETLQLNSNQTHLLPRSRRHALQRKPLLPVEPRNLRQPGLRRKKRRRGRGDKSSAKGIRLKRDQQGRFKGPRSRTFEGGKTPLYRRLPKWPAAWLGRRRKRWEHLNLAKVRRFLEQGRLDARFPITQRHLHDSRCVKVRNGVHLFNVNNYPFPYKITIDVASADQSSVDAIRRVGGEVRVVYRHPLNLRAHVKPYKFDVLPKTARPGLEDVHFLEKLRARGCSVFYIKPQWMEEEEKRLQAELQELQAEAAAAAGQGAEPRGPLRVDGEALAAYRAAGLRIAILEKQEESRKKRS